MSNYDLELYTVRNIILSFRKVPRKDTGFIFSSSKIFLDSSYLLKGFLLYYLSSGGILMLSKYIMQSVTHWL